MLKNEVTCLQPQMAEVAALDSDGGLLSILLLRLHWLLCVLPLSSWRRSYTGLLVHVLAIFCKVLSHSWPHSLEYCIKEHFKHWCFHETGEHKLRPFLTKTMQMSPHGGEKVDSQPCKKQSHTDEKWQEPANWAGIRCPLWRAVRIKIKSDSTNQGIERSQKTWSIGKSYIS